jgi:hypothetical protein
MYVTTLSLPILQKSVVGLLVENELEGIWKETVLNWLRYYPTVS